MSNLKETIRKVVDRWFLYEPLLFNVYCTHKLEENTEMKCFFRTGKRLIEYNPGLLKNASFEEIEMGLKTEVTRILLKHPYQRVPPYPNRAALTTASDVTIREHCFQNIKLHNAAHYNFEEQLSYEEYYRKLSLICPNVTPDGEYKDLSCSGGKRSKDYEESQQNGITNDSKDFNTHLSPVLEKGETWEYEVAASCSENWDEDEEMADKVNMEIEKAQKSNQWGSLTGQFQEIVTASLKIPMDYRRILSQFRASIISQRRQLTRMKPNRRYGFEFMGSQFEPKIHLLVAVDVSGSIETEDLMNFISIINRFFSYGVEFINILTFDTEIKQEVELKKAAKSIKIIGRGGTDFQCVIDYYESHPEYQGLIVFTDGYADIPITRLYKQILWILTGKHEFDIAIKWIKNLKFNKATWIPRIKSNA